jgi:hypothetical protein
MKPTLQARKELKLSTFIDRFLVNLAKVGCQLVWLSLEVVME